MPKSKNRRKPKKALSAAKTAQHESQSSGGRAAGSTTITADAAETKTKSPSVGPLQFFRQVRDEAQKITWTTRNETMISTIMVLIMVAIASIFFFFVDQILRWIVPAILQIG